MRVLYLIAALSLITWQTFADEDHADDHDHDHEEHGHEHHAEEADTGASALLKHLGGALEMVEDRAINGAEVTALPHGSVFIENGRHFVYAHHEGKIERWEVTLGRSDDHYIEAKTGVFPGDQVVIRHLIQAPQPQPGHRPQVAAPTYSAPVAKPKSSHSRRSHSSHRHGSSRHKHHHRGHHHHRRH